MTTKLDEELYEQSEKLIDILLPEDFIKKFNKIMIDDKSMLTISGGLICALFGVSLITVLFKVKKHKEYI